MTFSTNHKQLAILIDPHKGGNQLSQLLPLLQKWPPHYILVGGSMVSDTTTTVIETIRQYVSVPVFLFPGSAAQFSPAADALMYLSLISGRNPDYLIGQHVQSAMQVYQTKMPVIPVGYMLVESGSLTSVQYVSCTQPIPRTKNDIAVATALAGQYLGQQAIYLEGGSGAQQPVPLSMITAVKQHLSIPLIVGGGIRTPQAMTDAFAAGADVVVIGNVLEENPSLYPQLVQSLALL
ncbi:MAG: geranylgeranylglyceryl/heptaprenylglyceryl phosphate synthase [Paludibacteraceae bacterium]|nr:geranylgeranylglyceryl/heptaprenylglyceryl phosphate synthase [Paludibacteraceae bacterium]